MNVESQNRLGAALGIFLGVMSMVAGGIVLLGLAEPGYAVTAVLLGYNAAMGAVSLVVGIGLWQGRAWAVKGVWGIIGLHAFVFVGLMGWRAAGGGVALQSIGAMGFRTLAWGLIAGLTRPGR